MTFETSTIKDFKLLNSVIKIGDLSYILYHKSMNGLSICVSIAHSTNELINNTNMKECDGITLKNTIESNYRYFQIYIIDAIVYFQAMIESDLNNWIKQYNLKKGSFRDNWNSIQKQFNIKSQYFEKWHKIYTQYRNTLLHANDKKLEKHIDAFNNITIYELYDCIKNGWFAYTEVLHAIENKKVTENILENYWIANMKEQNIDTLKVNLKSFDDIPKMILNSILNRKDNVFN